MENGSEAFAKSIGSAAQDRLAKSTLGMTYTLQEQGGVNIAEGNSLKLSPETQTRVTSLLGITELTSQLRHSLFEKAAQGQMADSSEQSPEQRVIANQDRSVQELLGDNPKLLDKLAEITAKARVFSDLLGNQQPSSTTQELGMKVAAWEHTIDEIAQSLCGNDTEKAYYQQLVASNLVKLNNPTTRTVKGADGQPQTKFHESYTERLALLIQKPRAVSSISSHLEPRQGQALADNLMDEYLETAFTLNAVRVLDRIQRPLGFNSKFKKLTACLKGWEAEPAYIQLIESNNLREDFSKLRAEIAQINKSALSDEEKEQKIQDLNDQFKNRCEPAIENAFNKETDTDEAIDLVGTRQNIIALQQQMQEIKASKLDEAEKKQRLANLDKQMQTLFIPIANKVARIFPHKSSTNLTEVLEKEEAICAGKVNVLLATSKYLGVNARANSVKETLNNETAGHVCFECDLPSGSKLVIDANFENITGWDNKTDDELTASIRNSNPDITDPELESELRYTKLAIANSRSIPADSRVLMYITENTSQIASNEVQLKEARQKNLLVRINPYSGQQEIWKAAIPHPHLVTFPDKDGYLCINSSFTNNTGNFVSFVDEAYRDIGIYLLRKQIEMSPYDAKAYAGFAELLPAEEGLAFLEKAKKEKPALYWEGMSIQHALIYAHQGNLDRASQIFEETKVKNPPNYYKELYKLAAQFKDQASKETGETANQYRARAVSLMEQARRENAALFYSHSLNVLELTTIYRDQPEKKIELYEEFKKVQEAAFWETTSYPPPFEQLAELYLEQDKKNPVTHSKAVELTNEIKTRQKRFYAKMVCYYASKLYLEGEQKDPPKAIAMLEEAKAISPETFFQNDNNVITLAQTYEKTNNNEQAIAVYEEYRSTNPDLFWSKNDLLYENLVLLYKKTNQKDKAIAVCEEAKTKSNTFWQPLYSKGYSQLVSLYSEAGKLPDAIAISVEARTKDPNFFNPDSTNGGYVQLASLYSDTGQIDEAISTMLHGKDIDQNFWKRHYGVPNVFKLVDIYEKGGRLNEAMAVLTELKEKNSNYWKTDYYRICELYEKSGDAEKAKQIRSELLSVYEGLKASDLDAYYASSEKRAVLYLSEGQRQKAIQALEEGKEHYPYFPIKTILTLAELYIQEGDRDKAKSAYQDAIDVSTEVNKPENIPKIRERAKSNGIDLASEK